MIISITDEQVFTALRSFLLSVLPSGVEVIQTQDNGVPMPIGGFVSMNNVSKIRLSTNVNKYRNDPVNVVYGTENVLQGTEQVVAQTSDGFRDVTTPTQYTMQLDFYGESAGEWASLASNLFRDPYATDLFPDGIKPLYADDPIQIPLIDGEMNYTQRWKLQAVMQYNPSVSLAQKFAREINVVINDPSSPDPVIAETGIRCVEVNYPNP